jgi:hypothetical protein
MRYHYISLAFADDGGRTRSITLKSLRKEVTAPLIREAIQALDMTENVTLLSSCWLGKMTDQQYIEGFKPLNAWVITLRVAVVGFLLFLSFLLYWFAAH